MLEIVELADPVGTVVRGSVLPNGLSVAQTRVPFGVIGAIYEARPNVTIDIAALALKSGNAVMLRGGSAAEDSNRVLVDVIQTALVAVRRSIRACGADSRRVWPRRREGAHAGSRLC